MSNVDERIMICEQERLAKEAKRQKTKKIKVIIGVIVLLAVIGVIWYVGWGRKLDAQTAATTVKIEKGVGQTVVYAKIAEINGNEITYAVAVEVEEESADRETFHAEAQRESMTMPDMGEMPKMGEMPNMGEMPSRGEMPNMGEMPDMSQMQGGGRGQREQGGNKANNATVADRFTYDGAIYRVGDETVTAYIPVGTDVTTKLGTVTTFSRLAAEDYVALVMEKDGDEEIIMAVYIVG